MPPWRPSGSVPHAAVRGGGADGTRGDPRFVRAGERVSSGEMAALQQTLKMEHNQVLTLQENLARHRAREGRLARYAEKVGCWPTPTVRAGVYGVPAPPVWGPELEEINRTMHHQQREIQQLGWECQQLFARAQPFMPAGVAGWGEADYRPQPPCFGGAGYGGVGQVGASGAGLRVSISAGDAQSEELLTRAPYAGLKSAGELRLQAGRSTARWVAWATPGQAREVGNTMLLEAMMRRNDELKASDAMADRTLADFNRQLGP